MNVTDLKFDGTFESSTSGTIIQAYAKNIFDKQIKAVAGYAGDKAEKWVKEGVEKGAFKKLKIWLQWRWKYSNFWSQFFAASFSWRLLTQQRNHDSNGSTENEWKLYASRKNDRSNHRHYDAVKYKVIGR